jgi:DamX protein
MQRIATLELSLPQVQKALEQRLQQVEKGQELGLEQQQRLHGRIDTLTRTVAVLKQDARLSNFPQQEVRWQRMAEIGQYSIQLLGMHELKALLAYAKRYPLDGERTYARTTYQGRDWYILLYGTFPGVQDARAALDALPDPIREHQPWIRELPVGPSFTAIP